MLAYSTMTVSITTAMTVARVASAQRTSSARMSHVCMCGALCVGGLEYIVHACSPFSLDERKQARDERVARTSAIRMLATVRYTFCKVVMIWRTGLSHTNK